MRLTEKKTFVVTGGLGFIGSHFVDFVLKKGHRVINYDKITYASNVDLKFVGDYEFRKKDISAIRSLPQCDFVVNFAAFSHVDGSIKESQEFIDSNFLGVYNLLEILKRQKSTLFSPLFIQISTDEVFGDIEPGEFCKEESVHVPSNPYSATKSAAEQMVVAYGRTYDIPYIITRSTNNYGIRQHCEKLIPTAILSIFEGKKVPIYGIGDSVRNWVHVLDNVEAIYQILDKGEEKTSYHIASDEELSVKDIVEVICETIDVKYSEVTKSVPGRPGGDKRYGLNCSKLKKLGWTQKRNFADEMKTTVQFYRAKLDV